MEDDGELLLDAAGEALFLLFLFLSLSLSLFFSYKDREKSRRGKGNASAALEKSKKEKDRKKLSLPALVSKNIFFFKQILKKKRPMLTSTSGIREDASTLTPGPAQAPRRCSLP